MKKTLFTLAAMFSSSAAYAADGAPQSNPLAAFAPLIIFVAIFYFFVLRPQKKRQKTHDDLVNALQRGDKVITAGGFFGIVRDVKDDSVIIEIAEGLVARVLKSSISTKINNEPKPAPKPAPKAEEAPKVEEAPKAEAAKVEEPTAEVAEEEKK